MNLNSFLSTHYDTYQMRILLKKNKLLIAVLVACKYQLIRSWFSVGKNIRNLLITLRFFKPTLWEQMIASYLKPSSARAPYIPKHTERSSTYAEDHWGAGNIHR